MHHWDTFKDVNYVKTFTQMKQRYDQYEHSKLDKAKRESIEEKKPSSPPAIVNAQWKKEKEYESDELFFNKDDEEEEVHNMAKLILVIFRTGIQLVKITRVQKPLNEACHL